MGDTNAEVIENPLAKEEENVSFSSGSSRNRNQTNASKIYKPCWYYVNYNYCKFGRYCKFVHPRQNFRTYRDYNTRTFPENQRHKYNKDSHSKVHKDTNTSPQLDRNEGSVETRRKNFRIFTNSNRAKRNFHENQNPVQSIGHGCRSNSFQENNTVISSNNLQENNSVTSSRQPHNSASLSVDELQNLRKTEIAQLKKRYPNLTERCENDCDIFSFCFSSSDPDWAFDLNSVEVEVHMNHEYPKKACDIIISNEDERMPPLLLKHLNGNVLDWINDRYSANNEANKTELILRPFLKWLDRNLEQLFIEGLRRVKREVEAKQAGLEFVPFEDILVSSTSVNSSEKDVQEDSSSLPKECLDDVVKEISDLTIVSSEVETENSSQNSNVQEATSLTSRGKKGTEVKLSNFELKENAASLQSKKIALRIRCSRCKTYSDIEGLSRSNSSAFSCSKCHQAISVGLNPVLLHSFSSVLGYLHLSGCQPVDLNLVQSQFIIGCLNCNKTNEISGINYGQPFVTWCLFCNHKLCVSAQSAKFIQLQPEEKISKLGGNVISFVDKKKSRDPVIEVGKPLPYDGTCKHYKKSHRWLRFPCCGKVYACDVCHDEKETDHEMKLASRMLCGFCSKEQPYSKDKPCITCSSILTKKSGCHWEGGKGCRDRTKMCRVDKQKYAGINKTISRKAVGVTTKKK